MAAPPPDAHALASLSLAERSGGGAAASDEEADEETYVPLPALFARGAAAHRALDAGPAPPQAAVAGGVAALRAAAEAVSRLSLFSSNEGADDVATADLKYLLVPFYLAELLLQLRVDDRAALVAEAQRQLEFFLAQCEAYGLIPAPLRAARERGAAPMDAATLRAEKVARFKRDKELAARLAALEARAARRGAAQADDDDRGAGSDDDEAEAREAWLLRIGAALGRALDLGPSLATEAQLLAARAAAGPQTAQQQQQQQQPQREDVARGVAAAAAALARSDKERLRAGVFRPSHILPTMSIEQFGELEAARMRAEAQQRAAAAAAAEAERRNGPALDADAEEDAAVMKARAWDDWKDDHPFGYGNSKRRPCG